MSKENGQMEKRVPTLLELAGLRDRKPPSPTLSSSSDDDKPPVASAPKRYQEKSIENIFQPLGGLLARSRSTLSIRFKGNAHIEKDSMNTLLDKRRASCRSFTANSNNYLQPPSLAAAKDLSKSQSTIERKATFTPPEDSDQIEIPPSSLSRNYHIKAIRKGIPEIVSTDTRGKIKRIIPTDVKISPYCVCIKNPKRRTDLLAWLFSIVTVFLCIICPLLSFAADVTFLEICRENYNETSVLLQTVNDLYGNKTTSFSVENKPPKRHLNEGHHDSLSKHNRPIRYGRDIHRQENEYKSYLYRSESVSKLSKRSSFLPLQSNPVENATEQSLLLSLPTQESTASPYISLPSTNYENTAQLTFVAKCQSPRNTSICGNQTELIRYLLTADAKSQLHSHRHVTDDVFEPLFILGSFPGLLLSMFARSVIMLTSHNHFLSAYVMNMVTMPLQLATGSLAFHSASYHFGPFGFECWKCSLQNCTEETDFELKDKIGIGLIAATAAKFLDGVAGGIVLVVVLFRMIWIKGGHASCWWHLARSILSLMAILFCVIVSTTMLLTPSVAVLQSELIEKMNFFEEKDSICYSSLVFLSIGATAWGGSLLVLVLYLTYRTYVFCRINEHLTEDVLL